MTIVAIDHVAEGRFQQLGLSADLLVRALLRADAEAKLTTGLEPPTAEGTTRYGKTVRYVREELIPLGWKSDNYRNFCRTIHPSGSFSIATSSGDEFTGVDVPGMKPSTKYPKGDLTALAVKQNANQGVLDLGDDYAVGAVDLAVLANIWILLQRVTDETIYAELSLPTGIENGVIVDWEERILLPQISRQNPPPAVAVEEPPSGDGDAYNVEVALR
ncbi:hypothetical protein [Ornithinimicrobium cryptoxanthini]|uniref:Uncharacterized protein n=1 Tax=Ornithinimicrobium cryptoxanthini TaxID=2934161 RepID=A0ABY4YJ37_9MICO|nr:hypothetical protein [Ornithinimicrobium cryptoxanthini]USQ76811.1 hypothetical protein NF557_02450 [Ornithinimicrobium cryptoxanthini]